MSKERAIKTTYKSLDLFTEDEKDNFFEFVKAFIKQGVGDHHFIETEINTKNKFRKDADTITQLGRVKVTGVKTDEESLVLVIEPDVLEIPLQLSEIVEGVFIQNLSFDKSKEKSEGSTISLKIKRNGLWE